MNIDLETYIVKTNAAKNNDELFSVFKEIIVFHGFDSIQFVLLNDHNQLDKEAKIGYALSFPEDWMNYYFSKRYDLIDPVIDAAQKKIGAFTWDQMIKEYHLSKKQLRILNEASDAGLNKGISVPLRGVQGALAGISIASTDRVTDINPLLSDKISLMSEQLYQCFWRLHQNSNSMEKINLSNREKDILSWSAKGLSRSQIADKFFISEHTVDYHIRKILKKTKAQNMTSAVFQAIRLNLIQL